MSFPGAEIAGGTSHHHALLMLLFILDLVAVNIPRHFVMNILSEKSFIKLCLGSGNAFVEYLLSIEVTLFGLQQHTEPVALVLTCDPKT